MGTKVSSIFGDESKSEKAKGLVTRDLLGGSSSMETQELDLDLHVPSGWEKRLDLKSGKVYIQRHNSLGSPSMSEHKIDMNEASPKLEDLNLPPPSSKVGMNQFDETSLDLKLVPSLPSGNYQSVCTLDKVKSALERAEKEPMMMKKASLLKPSNLSFSSLASSIRDTQEEESEGKLLSSPMAAGCPGCLSYVLITKNNPKCPRCKSVVPFPLIKKPRIDLNISI
ncbi:uncharacterized protein LOC113866133 [Abrus precatorius]|uniref:Uncharacterized protein LOC113866133 n=1 Tax=Abrus precatorius TaxID=3816 RepID=A0A8B8LLI9_ABRPR|nr:uncharacterized protein LOC113866133 [Abrus precatorius]